MLQLSKRKIILAIAVSSFTNTSYSQDLSYSYIQGSYISTTIDLDTVELDGNGFAVSGSFAVNNNLAITAAIGSTSYDTIAGIDLDTNEIALGLIAHTEISSNTDLFGGLAIFNGEFEITDGSVSGSIDDTGNILSAGIRSMVSDNLELNVSLARTDLFDVTDTAFSLGAQFYANEKLSFGAAFVTAEDVDSLVFNVRIDL